ncbi:SixA phosphatase family protein [Alkalilacustris brevis]|uniref:SixA phosphatase family protein n=1 Tax=Alkalilacustris brevis TaxID=2026338 RepID=UPI000E0DC90C|nr:histidine phosphatase family protein [Alkalilacustris brevis]
MSRSSPFRVILTRHAQSGWEDTPGGDHARTLTAQGQEDARRVGRWLAHQGLAPDTALVSTARRTRETWENIAVALPDTCTVEFLDELYRAGPDVMLHLLRRARGKTVLMLGHNPGIAECARLLLDHDPAHPQFATYPPCATLVAEFRIAGWTELRFRAGQAMQFIVPADLADTENM